MSRLKDTVRGLGVGLAVAYLFDPERGRRRRATARDKVISGLHTAGGAIETTKRDVNQRARGVWAGLRAGVMSAPVSDAVLAERVRAQLGGSVSRPSAITVTAVEGRIALSGRVRADEHARLVRRVGWVRGVQAVEDRLEPSPDDASPGANGPDARLRGAPRRGPRWEFFQVQWSPTARLMAGAAGAVLGLYGLRRSGLDRAIMTATGGTLLARAAANMPLERMFGIGADGRATLVQKTLEVEAPVSAVFEIWSRYEQFPRFMTHVRDVRRTAGGHSHWTVAGPGGLPIEWDAVETAREQDRLLAWRTVDGSPVAHSGRVRFQGTPEGATRLDIRMWYAPPAGAVGHAVASLIGVGPKHAMDADLVRLKSLLEDGRTSGAGQPVTRQDVATASAP
jgi:uncharacterized membrane protein